MTQSVALCCDASLRMSLVSDASCDRLDAVLCFVQVAVSSQRPGDDLPSDVGPLKGWIAA